MKHVIRIKSSAKEAMILLMFTLGAFSAFAQSTLFSITNQPSSLDDAQVKALNHASTSPHVGDLKFVQFASVSSIGQNGSISIAIPGVNNGTPLTFDVQNAVFDDTEHFSIMASGSGGYLNLYFAPEGIGGTIDLVNRLFALTPFGSGKGLLMEREITNGNVSTCGNEGQQATPREIDFCVDDCGSATLDVLLLRTPEANNWLQTTWGWLSEWFLFVEGHNINLAFANSDIPNKRVRVTPINFTPSFQWSTNSAVDLRIIEDLNSISNSASAQSLMSLYSADIVVLLTNNNYTGGLSTGGSGTIFGRANSLDPFSTNKFCITQVANIDPSRYTLAHEVAHQFGCLHSNPLTTRCAHGRNMPNGRNTIMANFAADFSRIPHYSNPDINFGGEATGVVDTRNNAQQIRGAFCESANNNPDPQFSVFFSKSSVGPICLGEVHTFTSTIIQGDCIEPFGIIPSVNCGVWPYQYEWRLSNNPNFINSQIIGTAANVTFTIQTCPFYLRLTVTSSNGLTTTSTRFYNCAPGVVCDRDGNNLSDEKSLHTSKLQAIPNPASDEVNIIGDGIDLVTDVQCFNLQGTEIPISFFKAPESGIISINRLTLSPGLYLFRVSGNNLNNVIKVVIQ